MSFSEWLENGVMRRHPEWFEREEKSMPSKNEANVAVKAQMPKVEVKAPQKPVSVPTAAVVEEDWDAAEVVKVEEKEEWWNL